MGKLLALIAACGGVLLSPGGGGRSGGTKTDRVAGPVAEAFGMSPALASLVCGLSPEDCALVAKSIRAGNPGPTNDAEREAAARIASIADELELTGDPGDE